MTFHLDEDETAYYARACNQSGPVAQLAGFKETNYSSKDSLNKEIKKLIKEDEISPWVAKILRDMIWNISRWAD